MTDLKYVKAQAINMKGHPALTEKWVQGRIAEDPSMLGLGDVVLKDKERNQPGAGRLDLLMQDVDSTSRYEIEVQLGRTDESHIVRTLEYWDLERKRYPQYNHTAVIVAEEISGRFLNVISLFNGFIPIVALQMSAFGLVEHMTLVFTKVMAARTLGLVEEDEAVQTPTDRNYWESRATKSTVSLADDMLEIVRTIDAGFELKYNKFYIGLARDGKANNFVTFRPKKNFLRLEAYLPQSEDIESQLEQAGLEAMDYDSRRGRYCIRLTKPNIKAHSDLLTTLLRNSYEDSGR